MIVLEKTEMLALIRLALLIRISLETPTPRAVHHAHGTRWQVNLEGLFPSLSSAEVSVNWDGQMHETDQTERTLGCRAWRQRVRQW